MQPDPDSNATMVAGGWHTAMQGWSARLDSPALAGDCAGFLDPAAVLQVTVKAFLYLWQCRCNHVSDVPRAGHVTHDEHA